MKEDETTKQDKEADIKIQVVSESQETAPKKPKSLDFQITMPQIEEQTDSKSSKAV